MTESKLPTSTMTDRVLATVAAPFVLGWDLIRSGFFRLCRVMERLDPFELLGRLVARIAPPLAAIIRRLWLRTLSIRLWFAQTFSTVYRAILVALGPLLRMFRPLVSTVARFVATAFRQAVGWLRRSAVVVHRVLGPTLNTIWRRFRLVSSLIAGPIRRVVSAARAAFHRGAWWTNGTARRFD